MAAEAQPPPAKGKGKKLPPQTMAIIVLGIALAAGAFLLWRQRSTAAAATTAPPAPNNEDLAGQIATLQGEIADLQSTGAQDEAAETGTGTTTTPPPVTTPPPAGGGLLAAPALSVTPHAGGVNAGWGAVPGAKVYELVIAGAGGSGTGTSHYDHVASATHATVNLMPGRYTAKVRAGKSATDVHGHWSASKPFTVPKSSPTSGTPKPPKVTSGGSSGESED